MSEHPNMRVAFRSRFHTTGGALAGVELLCWDSMVQVRLTDGELIGDGAAVLDLEAARGLVAALGAWVDVMSDVAERRDRERESRVEK